MIRQTKISLVAIQLAAAILISSCLSSLAANPPSSHGYTIELMRQHTGMVDRLAVSPNGKLLATAGSDRLIHVWDLSSKRLLRSWLAHDSRVAALTFAPDITFLVSADP